MTREILFIAAGVFLAVTARAGFNPPQGPNAAVQAVAVQQDSKVLVGGLFSAWDGFQRAGLVRLHSDGTVDKKFDAELSKGASVRAIKITKNEDGEERILVGGSFSEAGGKKRRFLVRLEPDGSVDGRFDTDGGPDGPVYGIAVQRDGKVLVAGSFTKVAGKPSRGVARLTARGALDAEFKPGRGVEGTAHSVVVAEDGLIYVGGVFIYFDGRVSPYIARLSPNGQFDSAFSSRLTPATESNAGIYSLALDARDRLYAGGSFRFVTEEGARRDNIVRLRPDGSGDPAFNPGVGADHPVHALLPVDGDRIMVGGAFEGFGGRPGMGLVRVDEHGNVERKFQSLGFDGAVLGLALGPKGGIFAGGNFFHYGDVARNGIVKLDNVGNGKYEFAPVFGPNDKVFDLAITADGNLIVGGKFTSFGGRKQSRVAKVDAEGKFDESFGRDLQLDGAVRRLAVAKSGHIYIAGEFQTINGNPVSVLARLTAAGAYDPTFQPMLAPNSKVNSMLVQDDKLVIGGQYLNLNGQGVPSIVRLLSNGGYDAHFQVGSAANGVVHVLKAQPDGKILVGGNFTNLIGEPRKSFGRLNADGSVDRSFDTGNGVKGDVLAIAFPGDGRVIVAGEFTANRRRNMARFLSSGEIDVDYKPPPFGLQQPVNVLVPWKKKKLILAGAFLKISDDNRQRVAVVDEDGALTSDLEDLTTDGAVSAILTSGDRLLLGGTFATINGVAAMRLAEIDAKARLVSDDATRTLSSLPTPLPTTEPLPTATTAPPKPTATPPLPDDAVLPDPTPGPTGVPTPEVAPQPAPTEAPPAPVKKKGKRK